MRAIASGYWVDVVWLSIHDPLAKIRECKLESISLAAAKVTSTIDRSSHGLSAEFFPRGTARTYPPRRRLQRNLTRKAWLSFRFHSSLRGPAIRKKSKSIWTIWYLFKYRKENWRKIKAVKSSKNGKR